MRAPFFWQQRGVIAWLVWPCSLVFALIIRCRRWFYQTGIFKQQQATIPVIVVGNITVGGTGKTPVVIALAQWLQQQGHQPVILSRGYRANPPAFPYWVQTTSTAAAAGDEPLLLAQQTQVAVIIDANRTRAIKAIEQTGKFSIILCDDGLQHYALARDVEIVVMDSTRYIGNGFLLPAGMLREPISRCKEAQFVVWNGSLPTSNVIANNFQYALQLQPTTVYNLQQSIQRKALTDFAGMTVHAMAGIGNPQRFFTMLRQAGIHIIEHPFPDHHVFQAKDFPTDELPILITEKDAVKCRGFLNERIWCVAVTAILPQAFYTQLTDFLKKCKSNVEMES